MPEVIPYVSHISTARKDGWSDPLRGNLTWHTLISGDLTPTDSLTAGVGIFQEGDSLNFHSHPAAEIYYVLEGEGIVTLDGKEHAVTAGSVIFIPGNTLHGVRNDNGAPLHLFYAFAKDSFKDVEYEFQTVR